MQRIERRDEEIKREQISQVKYAIIYIAFLQTNKYHLDRKLKNFFFFRRVK